jgi:hypothetical protein
MKSVLMGKQDGEKYSESSEERPMAHSLSLVARDNDSALVVTNS